MGSKLYRALDVHAEKKPKPGIWTQTSHSSQRPTQRTTDLNAKCETMELLEDARRRPGHDAHSARRALATRPSHHAPWLPSEGVEGPRNTAQGGSQRLVPNRQDLEPPRRPSERERTRARWAMQAADRCSALARNELWIRETTRRTQMRVTVSEKPSERLQTVRVRPRWKRQNYSDSGKTRGGCRELEVRREGRAGRAPRTSRGVRTLWMVLQ